VLEFPVFYTTIKMADSDSCENSSNSCENSSNSSFDYEETIWSMGEVSTSALEGYRFEPRRSALSGSEERVEEASEEEEDNDNESGGSSQSQESSEFQTKRLTGMEEFCTCQRCEVQTLSKEEECVCCQGPELDLREFHNEEGERLCVTKTVEFQEACLRQHILRNVLLCLNDSRGDAIPSPASLNAIPNEKYRWVAYRQFTWWIYEGKIGRKNRKVIPACAVAQIRKEFPLDGQTEEFVSYQLAEESD
jgi:hypothetical protein